MAKAMTFGGMAVAGLSLLLFGLDLATTFPFGRQSWLIDIGFVICAGILGYLSWSAYRDL
ncbi:hypothetical protein [Aeoliella sp.]|uniref:hypothetical protein n=1 Tax=Aeoliella sp. TaxID=2795800 RepID=UPI003CCC3D78